MGTLNDKSMEKNMNRTNKNAYWLSSLVVATFAIVGCNQQDDPKAKETAKVEAKAEQQQTALKKTEQKVVHEDSSSQTLQSVLAKQPEKVQARYSARHPQETLSFFEIQSGQTVVEALPGGGWYTKLILPVLGKDGKVIGADYAADMYPKFGFFSAEDIEKKKTWVDSWTEQANSWRAENDASVAAFQFGSMPETMHGTADRVLFIRALHNLARFDNDGGFLTKALADTFNILKSGGMVGIVQHKAPEELSDDWANGSNGYLKVSFIKAKMAEAGFEFVGESDINLNLKDQPTEKDFVWRLPPTFASSRDNPELKKQYEAIGESSRMTLKFKKP
jgi:predicted methyltransferase